MADHTWQVVSVQYGNKTEGTNPSTPRETTKREEEAEGRLLLRQCLSQVEKEQDWEVRE